MPKKKQTRTIHIFDGEADVSAFKGITVVGRNDHWTSCVPKAPTTFDSVPISEALGIHVFDMWFIEGEGVVARMHQHGLIIGVFALPDRSGAYNAHDLAEVLDLGDMVKPAKVKELKKLSKDQKALLKWTLDHGLEALLGLPGASPAPKTASKPKKKAKAASRRLR